MAKQQQAVATVEPQNANLPAEYDWGEFAGLGFENQTQEDQSIPFLNLLQSNSPQCSDDENYPDAKPGKLFNTVTGELFDSKNGVVFAPCSTKHQFVEWVPRDSGGGFVAAYDINDPYVIEARKNAGRGGAIKLPNGNDLVETFYMYGYICSDDKGLEFASPVVVSFKSTAIKPYRDAMTSIGLHAKRFPKQPPLFAYRLRLTSIKQEKDGYTFFNYVIKPLNGAPKDSMISKTAETAGMFDEAAAFARAVLEGTKRADHAKEQRGSSGGGAASPDGEVPF